MPDENNPTIYIEYSDEAFPPTNWQSLKEYALDFKVTNSGIFRTPQLDLNLKNRNGRFTGNDDITIQTAKLMRVRADVRDVIDTLFYGRVRPFTSSNKSKREVLNISASGLVTQKLLWDTITKNYLKEQNEGETERTMKQVIEHMLSHPDSDPEGTGGGTGVTLVTDSGDITTVTAKHNFDRENLLDAIKQICEYLGYAGYEEVSGSALNLHLYPYGWQTTNPAITIPTAPQEIIEREYTVDDPIYNYIMLWAGTQIAYPDSDRFTERGVEKGYWSAGNAETTVADSTEQVQVNNKNIKITKGNDDLYAILDLSSTFPSGLDIKDKGITDLCFWLYVDRDEYSPSLRFEPSFGLEDTNGDRIGFKLIPTYHEANKQMSYRLPLAKIVGDNYEYWRIHRNEIAFIWDRPYWNQYPETTFNWKIKKIIILAAFSGVTQTKFRAYYIDGLHFEGAIECNPIRDPSLASSDATSIAAYGKRVLHYDMPAIKDYSAIKTLADKVLDCTKNPIVKLKLKYGAKTWIKPNQTLTVNLPVYGISNKTYRIVEFAHEWSTKTKLLRTTFGLTPQFLADGETVRPVTSREWYAGELNRILKDLIW